MRTRAIAAVLSAALLGSALPTAVLAQMDADTKEAKALFDDGKTLYKAGKFEEARVKFKAAYGLKKRPSIVINLAMAELQTKRPLDAAHHFREVLTLADAKPEDKDDARAGINDARKMLGVIHVEAPVGATVTVDGELKGTVPILDGIEVMPGMHSVAIKTADGKQTAEKVTLFGGQSTTVKVKATGEVKPTPVPSATVPPPATTTPPPATTTPPPATTTPPADTTPPPADTTPPPVDPTPPKHGQKGYLLNVHYVTWGAAGAAVLCVPFWIAYYSSSRTHAANADEYAAAMAKWPTSTKLNEWRSLGRQEADLSNSQATTSLVFGVLAGVFTAGAVVSYFVLRPKKEPQATVVAAPLYGGGGYIGLAGQF